MRVVVSYMNFAGFAGTETYTLTVAHQLERLGHDTTIYSLQSGPIGDLARQQGLRVIQAASKLPDACDAVFAQDSATAYELAARYPTAVRTYVMHSAHNPMQSPPQTRGVCHAVIVLNDRLRRRAEHLAWCPEVVRLRQPIDLKRFNIAGSEFRGRRRPRVIALSNHTDGPRMRIVQAACSEAGVELMPIGSIGRVTPHPEHAIAGAEIVISLGRGVLEAMAGGRAAYVFGHAGGDSWVTTDNYPVLESDGFSGRATDLCVDGSRLAADLAAWQEGMGEPGRHLVFAHHDGERHAIELVELVERIGGRAPPSDHLDELARLVRLEWYSYARAEAAIVEHERMRAEADGVRQEADALREQAGVLREQADVLREEANASRALSEQLARDLHALRSTRRYRLACKIASPLDHLRARRRRALPAKGTASVD